MISQNCPKCFSDRIRRGYRPTPIWLKVLFRYHLLCDACNWEFTGFAVPGTVSYKSKKKVRKPKNEPVEKISEKKNIPVLRDSSETKESELSDAASKDKVENVKKRVKANY